MNINDFAKWTDSVWKSGAPAEGMDDKDLSIVSLGLAGETGEALEYVKKYLRDNKDPRFLNDGRVDNERAVEFAKELGDVLYYWCRLVRWAGHEPTDIIELVVDKLEKRHSKRIGRTYAQATGQ
jgi:NTP pyrophosphatase (non-canonical NTP hydrolase)